MFDFVIRETHISTLESGFGKVSLHVNVPSGNYLYKEKAIYRDVLFCGDWIALIWRYRWWALQALQ
jgi:hypothetical protein